MEESYPAELPRSEPERIACQRLTSQQFADAEGIFAHNSNIDLVPSGHTAEVDLPSLVTHYPNDDVNFPSGSPDVMEFLYQAL